MAGNSWHWFVSISNESSLPFRQRALALLFHALPAGVYLVLVVHDEIVLECPVSLVEEASQILKQVMGAACREYLHTVALPEPEVLIDTFWHKG